MAPSRARKVVETMMFIGFRMHLTPAITCGPRRARALRAAGGGSGVRSLPRKARARPDLQVHRVVSGLHCSLSGDTPRVPPRAPPPLIVLRCQHSGKSRDRTLLQLN